MVLKNVQTFQSPESVEWGSGEKMFNFFSFQTKKNPWGGNFQISPSPARTKLANI